MQRGMGVRKERMRPRRVGVRSGCLNAMDCGRENGNEWHIRWRRSYLSIQYDTVCLLTLQSLSQRLKARYHSCLITLDELRHITISS